jgi:hypothetical protein
VPFSFFLTIYWQATYITVEEGTATVSLSATSAVVTSTLASVASPLSSGKQSGTSPATPSRSATPNGGSGLKVGNVPFTLVLTALTILVVA